MIIAVDFDGTLQLADGSANVGLITRLNSAQRQGVIVILWSCRAGKRLQDALLFLAHHGFRPNYVNQNAPQTIRQLGYDPRKVLADIYIDDKNG